MKHQFFWGGGFLEIFQYIKVKILHIFALFIMLSITEIKSERVAYFEGNFLYIFHPKNV